MSLLARRTGSHYRPGGATNSPGGGDAAPLAHFLFLLALSAIAFFLSAATTSLSAVSARVAESICYRAPPAAVRRRRRQRSRRHWRSWISPPAAFTVAG